MCKLGRYASILSISFLLNWISIIDILIFKYTHYKCQYYQHKYFNFFIFSFSGQTVSLSLDSIDGAFRGFIIQARDKDEKQVGTFQFEDNSVSHLTCGAGIHNSITHRDPKEKTGNIKFQFLVPI